VRLASGTSLITGGLGFMGSNLAHEIVGMGGAVRIYDAMLPGYGGNWANIDGVEDRVEVIVEDVRNKEALRSSVDGADYVFHYAAQVSHTHSMVDPRLDMDINLRGTLNLLEAIRGCKGDPKLVYIGTRGQYGEARRAPVDEDHVEVPPDIYGVHKSAAEKYCFVYARAYGLRVASLRFTNTYGPRHQMKAPSYGILNWFIRLALLGEAMDVWGGRQRREYLYVDDATSAAVLAAERKASEGEAFIVATSKSVRLLDAVKLVVKIARSGRYRVTPYPKERRALEVGDVELSNKKMRSRLGWRPKVSLEEGVAETVAFYRDRLRLYM